MVNECDYLTYIDYIFYNFFSILWYNGFVTIHVLRLGGNLFLFLIFSVRSFSPSLHELKAFSTQLERRMSRLNMVENEGIISTNEDTSRSSTSHKVSSFIWRPKNYKLYNIGFNKTNFKFKLAIHPK